MLAAFSDAGYRECGREMMAKTIAIDGPAAAGKSTLGKELARTLGYLYFDTGVMYRAVAYAVLAAGIPPEDEEQVSHLAGEIQIDVQPPSKPDGRDMDVLVDGQDVTWNIRQPRVEACVSLVAAYPIVRQALTAQQRRIGLRGHVVLVGRDIGTVVLPEADLKIYLDARTEERARRRFQERVARGEPASYPAILSDMRERDHLDSSRPVAPLKPAADAVILNSSAMSAGEVLKRAVALAKGLKMAES